ncbi:phytanoyl-CoA dioxygenase family protein [Gynuella sunshinyii]|uniref:Protein involved in biosynthesis of mitomycin antibiotics/polyketide fumonisin n=1 Tax=Gynuella sunshinyii YC6258 TaxID=1445510 RepID=A0A0C5VGL2_9GAMM|nr:phytanoyl-CoA dioxygenase family protein [Gynuella sunshinyii]AJQ93331.1 protein involved in biosynthesis of mitomycin antibiotics/polyketide fumonisin [Gynuella sunshinyii YC6258]
MSPVQPTSHDKDFLPGNDMEIGPERLADDIIEHVSALMDTAPDAGFAKTHIDALVTAFAGLTGISANDDLGQTLGMSLQSGIALSPVQAAKCLQDLMRTHTFIVAVTKAIQDQLAVKGQVEILYAGTGPYGLLLVPVLACLQDRRVRATLLDIHQENIAAVTRVVESLGIQNYIRAVELADATTWQPPQGLRFDIVLSETMNWMLKNEPQVLIFSHLQQYLRDTQSVLIPQHVVLDACLYNAGQFSRYCQGECDKPAETSLGIFACLNRQTATAIANGQTQVLNGTIHIPDPLPDGQNALKFRTEVQVYQDLWLRERQSSLCIAMTFDHRQFSPGDVIVMNYLFGAAANGEPPGFDIGFPDKSVANVEPVSAQQIGMLGIRHLQRLWHKAQLQKVGQLDSDLTAKEWVLDRTLIDLLGVGLGECLEFLYHQATDFNVFEQWLLDCSPDGFDTERVKNMNAVIDRLLSPPLPQKSSPSFLSTEQLAFWHEQGYLVVEGVLNESQCQATVDLIYQFLDKHPEQPLSWYEPHPAMHNIMVQLFRHPILDDNRRSETARKVFADLWQTDRLQCSVDRVGFNPPETDQYCFQGTRLHWDLDFSKPLTFSTQGLIYLTDVAQDQGAFRCVPGFHHHLQDWLAGLPSGSDPNQQDLSMLTVKNIAAPAGSLVIWHQFLPHGASPNRARHPRLVQYVNMTA